MTRFLLDVMCGGLRSYLRMCGHDAAYALDREVEADDRLLALADAEDRTIVTRDVQLAERSHDALCLTATAVEDQLTELSAAGVDLTLAAPPARCGRCNGVLEPVDPTATTPAYAPDPATTDCWRCRDCGQLFWKGSHWDRVAETLADR